MYFFILVESRCFTTRPSESHATNDSGLRKAYESNA